MKDEATEGKGKRGKKKNVLPSMMCFLFRPLSVSALQQEGKEEVDVKVDSHLTCTHARVRKVLWLESDRQTGLHDRLAANHLKRKYTHLTLRSVLAALEQTVPCV